MLLTPPKVADPSIQILEISMSIRQKKEILSRLYDDFVEYSLPRDISLQGYTNLVANPIGSRTIKKNFVKWSRIVRAMEIQYPDVFDGVPAGVDENPPSGDETPPPSGDETPPVDLAEDNDPLTSLSKSSVTE